MLLELSVSQIPFIELAFRDAMGEDIRFKDGVRSILEHIFPVYIMGILMRFCRPSEDCCLSFPAF